MKDTPTWMAQHAKFVAVYPTGFWRAGHDAQVFYLQDWSQQAFTAARNDGYPLALHPNYQRAEIPVVAPPLWWRSRFIC